MSYNDLTYEVKDGIAYITIARPEALNALSDALMVELHSAFKTFDSDDSAGCAILTGQGKAFVAGGDIAEMAQQTIKTGSQLYIRKQKLTEFIEEMSKPVIAAINGYALGGGCELCLSCDIRIAASTAKFGQLEINLGIIPIMGGTQRLPRLVGKGMAKYLIYTGEMIDAQEAHRIGLVEKIVPADQLLTECERIAKSILSKSPITITLAKAAVNLSAKTDLATGLIMEGYFATDAFTTADRVEGMTAFLEKRPPQFQNQ